MNELELAIYTHLSVHFRELIDVFREKNPEATFDQALKWAGAVLVQEQKVMDKMIAEMTDDMWDDRNFVPMSVIIEELEKRNV